MHYRPQGSAVIQPVSHDPDQLKKVFLSKGEVAPLLQIGEFTLFPQKTITEHFHPDAIEVFYMTAGTVLFIVDGKKLTLSPGDVLVIQPGEKHSVESNTDSPASFFYFLLLAPSHA